MISRRRSGISILVTMMAMKPPMVAMMKLRVMILMILGMIVKVGHICFPEFT